MDDQIKIQKSRRAIDAEIMVAMDQLEKASTLLTIEWKESAAEHSLLYVASALSLCEHQLENARKLVNGLRQWYESKEENAPRVE